jgi:hypothetical protein
MDKRKYLVICIVLAVFLNSLINFLELVYDKPENEFGSKIFRSFALSAKLISTNSDEEHSPFLHHVKEAISHYKELLKQYRSKVFSAVRQKDFIRIQLLSMAALHGLKRLELKHNCHLALSIHLIESIGLGARNADRLSQQFNGKADNFYRANLFLQTLGVKLFSNIDLEAQPLHEYGIGIIVNDLPAILIP